MTSKENQRRSLAFLVIFFLGFIYIEKVLTPYLKGSMPVKVSEVASAPVSASTSSEGEKSAPTLPVSTAPAPIEKVVENAADVRDLGVVNVDTGVAKFEISKRGGRILSIKLENYFQGSKEEGKNYEMIFNDAHSAYPLGVEFGEENDESVDYSLVESNDPLLIVLQGVSASGINIQKSFAFSKNSYLFDLDVKLGEGVVLSPKLVWTKKVSEKESSLLDPYNFTGFVAFDGESAIRTSFSDMKDLKSKKDLPVSSWVAVGDKYFATAIINKDASGFSSAHIERTNGSSFMSLGNGQPKTLSVKIFSGPKSYTLLNDLGFDLRRLIDLGKTGIISGPLLFLLNVFYKLVGNYGLAIVLLTIAVKLFLYKLNTSQFKQMKAMQALKPELDRIKENIKDKQQQQMALMELYKKKGVNPLGGCLPVLVQMPVFIGLYSALSLAIELRNAPFGAWVQDLSAPDSLMIAGFSVPMLVVLFTISMLVQQWITPSTMDPQQKKVMMIMPVFMFFMFKNFPAGLAVYWLTNNLISIGQQQGMHYNDRSGKSGFKITGIVAVAVFVIAYIFTLF